MLSSRIAGNYLLVDARTCVFVSFPLKRRDCDDIDSVVMMLR
jgi:hypothetical protein